MNPFNISADINAPAHIPKTKFIVRTNTCSYTNCDKNHHYAVADVRRHLLILVTNANRAFASCDGSLVMPLQGFSAILMETLLTFWGGFLAGLPTYPWKAPRRWTISHMALAYTAAPSSGGSQVDPSQILLLQVTNGHRWMTAPWSWGAHYRAPGTCSQQTLCVSHTWNNHRLSVWAA